MTTSYLRQMARSRCLRSIGTSRGSLSVTRSPIHYGAVALSVRGTPAETLEGVYWTDRLTRGDIQLADRRGDAYETYNAARVAFGD